MSQAVWADNIERGVDNTPSAEKDVQQAKLELLGALEGLTKQLQVLDKNVAPVMRDVLPQPAGIDKANARGNTPLGRELYEIAEKVDLLRRNLHEINDRISV